MSKSEILAALTASGQDKVFKSTPTWVKAFELYNAVPGRAKARMSCNGCWPKVLKWLQS